MSDEVVGEPSSLTIAQLKSVLTDRGVALPASNARKAVYVDLLTKDLAKVGSKATGSSAGKRRRSSSATRTQRRGSSQTARQPSVWSESSDEDVAAPPVTKRTASRGKASAGAATGAARRTSRRRSATRQQGDGHDDGDEAVAAASSSATATPSRSRKAQSERPGTSKASRARRSSVSTPNPFQKAAMQPDSDSDDDHDDDHDDSGAEDAPTADPALFRSPPMRRVSSILRTPAKDSPRRTVSWGNAGSESPPSQQPAQQQPRQAKGAAKGKSKQLQKAPQQRKAASASAVPPSGVFILPELVYSQHPQARQQHAAGGRAVSPKRERLDHGQSIERLEKPHLMRWTVFGAVVLAAAVLVFLVPDFKRFCDHPPLSAPHNGKGVVDPSAVVDPNAAAAHSAVTSPDCKPCPRHATCRDGRIVECDQDYVRSGLICIQDRLLERNANDLGSVLQDELAVLAGKFECNVPDVTPTMTDHDAQRTMRAHYPSLGEEFDKTWDRIKRVQSNEKRWTIEYDNSTDTWRYTGVHPALPIDCRLSRAFDAYRWYALALLAVLAAVLALRRRANKMREDVLLVADMVAEARLLLQEQYEAAAREPSLSAAYPKSHMRDCMRDFLPSDELTNSRFARLWRQVEAAVSSDSRVLETVKLHYGEQQEVWEWTAPITPGRSSSNASGSGHVRRSSFSSATSDKSTAGPRRRLWSEENAAAAAAAAADAEHDLSSSYPVLHQ